MHGQTSMHASESQDNKHDADFGQRIEIGNRKRLEAIVVQIPRCVHQFARLSQRDNPNTHYRGRC